MRSQPRTDSPVTGQPERTTALAANRVEPASAPHREYLPPAAEPVVDTPERTEPHDADQIEIATAPPRDAGPRRRTALQILGVFIGTFVVGYAIAALVLFPAPIFATSRSVPRLLGLSRAEAEARLIADGLRVGDIEGLTHPTAARGQIVWQDPPSGVAVPEGTLIRMSVSNGPQRVPVPDLLGYDATIAVQLLQATGLQVGRIDSTQAPVPQGVVVSTRPSIGSTILPGSSVTLVVSVGAPTITVPDLSGLTLDEAEIVLQQVGLRLGTTLRKASLDVPPGTIVEQNPGAGTLSAPSTIVNIFIARAPSR